MVMVKKRDDDGWYLPCLDRPRKAMTLTLQPEPVPEPVVPDEIMLAKAKAKAILALIESTTDKEEVIAAFAAINALGSRLKPIRRRRRRKVAELPPEPPKAAAKKRRGRPRKAKPAEAPPTAGLNPEALAAAVIAQINKLKLGEAT